MKQNLLTGRKISVTHGTRGNACKMHGFLPTIERIDIWDFDAQVDDPVDDSF
jgi:hypothetical protein